MNHRSCGERIVQFRNHFGLSQGTFSKEIGMSQPNVSKIESGQVEVSDTFLYALMGRFLVNPDWIKTGVGAMLLNPKEYIAKGITLLGAATFFEGLKQVVSDAQFAEFRTLLAEDELVSEQLDPEVMAFVRYILLMGQKDEKLRHWLLVQLENTFPAVGGK